MKKLLALTISLLITGSLLMANTALAGAAPEPKSCTKKSDCPATEICDNKTCKNLIDTLTKRQDDKEAANVKNLPDVSLEGAGSTIVKTLLGWSMLFTIIAIVVAAIYYLKSQGKEEDISKAKSILLYLVLGLAIMAGAYGIVSGITQLSIFD